jgi:SAM-dependent methyltransferase
MSAVVWHDLECGSYAEDLELWRALADERTGPILDVGAGTGRVALELARAGHRVTALDNDAELLAELDRRAEGLQLETVLADARAFELPGRFGLCLVPMQTIQLLGGPVGRSAFLRCAQRQLEAGDLVAIAISDTLELYEVHHGVPAPLPDICELDGIVYSSQPTAVRADNEGFVLERRRETVDAQGQRSVTENLIRLDRLSAEQLEREARAAGLHPAGRRSIPANQDYVGSTVVMLGA